ncbi:unnamed protein product [Closterium sp. NIES-53]
MPRVRQVAEAALGGVQAPALLTNAVAGTENVGAGASTSTALTPSVPLTELLGGGGLMTALLLLALTTTGATPLCNTATSSTTASAASATTAAAAPSATAARTAAADTSTSATTPTTTPTPSTASTTTATAPATPKSAPAPLAPAKQLEVIDPDLKVNCTTLSIKVAGAEAARLQGSSVAWAARAARLLGGSGSSGVSGGSGGLGGSGDSGGSVGGRLGCLATRWLGCGAARRLGCAVARAGKRAAYGQQQGRGGAVVQHSRVEIRSCDTESKSASPPSVGGECALGKDVLEDRQEDFECLAAAVPRFASMLLAHEGDPDAPDILTSRSYAESITGPYSSQWQAAMDAMMASWKSTRTYIDEVPPPGANIVDGMWIFRVKRPPSSPPAFKACYVARGPCQRQGVDYFQTFSPTPKMTTLRVLLHVAAQSD